MTLFLLPLLKSSALVVCVKCGACRPLDDTRFQDNAGGLQTGVCLLAC